MKIITITSIIVCFSFLIVIGNEQISAAPVIENNHYRMTDCMCNPPLPTIEQYEQEEWLFLGSKMVLHDDGKTESILIGIENKTAHELNRSDFIHHNFTIYYDMR